MYKHTSSLLVTAMIVGFLPVSAIAHSVMEPYEQDFVLTAYYSPLPNQCCYVKGSYEADKILNGEGTHGADGTAVYEGMLAAPPSYAFGTRIDLPGLGIMTVHDRGGAIQEWDDSHRLDVWAGRGEEGLARALAFGVKHVRGTVYPFAAQAPAESFTLETLPAPESHLKPYVLPETTLSAVHPSSGERGYSVHLLQENLATLGYFQHEVTGVYGEVTTQSLALFITDMGIDEPADTLTQKTGAYVQAAVAMQHAPSPVVFVGKESEPADVKTAQRMLRYLGYYRGRTDGQYSSVLFNSILSYQRDQQLVGNAASPGAGRIGPMTKTKLDREIQQRRIARAAQRILAMEKVKDVLAENERLLDETMHVGSNGKSVRMLQQFLADAGYFPYSDINGNYGAMTEKSVAAYQVARGILGTDHEKGSGVVGPVTLGFIRNDQAKKALMVVRAEGWEAL